MLAPCWLLSAVACSHSADVHWLSHTHTIRWPGFGDQTSLLQSLRTSLLLVFFCIMSQLNCRMQPYSYLKLKMYRDTQGRQFGFRSGGDNNRITTITTTTPPPPPSVAVVPVVGQSRRKLPGPNFDPSPSLSTGTYLFPTWSTAGVLWGCHRAYRMI